MVVDTKLCVEVVGDQKSIIDLDMELNFKEVGEVAADPRTCGKFLKKNGVYQVHFPAGFLDRVKDVILQEGCTLVGSPRPVIN